MDSTYENIHHRETVATARDTSTGVLTALALVVAGILFVFYPALRPFSSEKGLEGAHAFGSTNWIIAHSLAMAAFILLGLALLGICELVRGTNGERLAIWGTVLSWVGIGLTLPYYGAEVFGLHAVGQAVVDRNNPDLMSIVHSIRWEVGIFWILTGLALLAIGVILFAIAIWRSGRLANWAGIVLAVAFSLYIPQFAASQPVRVAHGILILLGGMLLAWAILSERSQGFEGTTVAKGDTPKNSSAVTLINVFEVPEDRDEEFLDGWQRTAAFMRQQPGSLSTRLHFSLNEQTQFRYVNVAEWTDSEAFQRAVEQEAFRQVARDIAFAEAHPSLYRVKVSAS